LNLEEYIMIRDFYIKERVNNTIKDVPDFLSINTKCMTIEFKQSNIKDVIPYQIYKYERKYNESPTHLYVNYEGYKALFYECNKENNSTNFEDYFMGLKIILVPDRLKNEDKIYIEVGIYNSNKDLFIKIATKRYEKKLREE